MIAVERWMKSGQNWAVGVSLYAALGKDEKLKKLFALGPSSFAKKKLESALKSIATSTKKEATSLPASPQKKKDIIDSETDVAVMPDSADNILQAIKNEWTIPYMEMNYLRHKMFGIDGNSPDAVKARGEMAFKVLELEQMCMKIWKKRDYYLEHGKLPDSPEKKQTIPADPIALAKFIENCKKNIRRNRKLMELHADNPDYAAAYNHYRNIFKQATGSDYIEKQSHAKQAKS